MKLPARLDSDHAAARPRVVVTQRSFDLEAVRYLEESGCTVVLPEVAREEGDGHLDRVHLAAILSGATAWIIGQARIDRQLLEDLPDLLVLSRRGVGVDRIDVAAAKMLRRVVTIASGGNHDAVADYTVAIMLSVLRRLRENQRLLESNRWSVALGADLTGKTVGLVGFGRIARAVAKRLAGFDVILLVDADGRHDDDILAAGGLPVSRQELLRTSDVVSLHAPLNDSTRLMINETTIATMKPTAVIINTSRGGLVQDADLLRALETGHLGGAGLDVFLSEQDHTFAAVTAKLVGHEKVFASPHAAASSHESIARANRIASDNVLTVQSGGRIQADRLIVDGRVL